MRHGSGYRKFQKSTAHTRAMLRNMVTSLIVDGTIETTVEKAKAVRPVAERLISAARVDSLASRRKVHSFLLSKSAARKLFAEVAPRFKSRPGGYTRVIRTRFRHGDAAQLAVLQLVE